MRARWDSLLGIVLTMGLLGGCETLRDPGPVKEEPGPAARALREAAEASREEPIVPPEAVRSTLLPPMPGLGPGPGPEEPRFDVSVHRTPAARFFMSLVEGTPYNMIVHPETKGEISLELKGVTIGQVMEMVRETYGYEYSFEDGTFRVSPPRLQSRIFTLDYLNLRRTGESQTRISSGQVSQGPNGQIVLAGAQLTGTTAAPSVSGSRITTESETDLWVEVEHALQSIVSTEGGGSVQISANSGVVIVRAMPAELRQVQRYLSKIETHLQRQVILEAKIIEVTLDDGFRSGINWAYLERPGRDDAILGVQRGFERVLGDGSQVPGTGDTGALDPRSASLPDGSLISTLGGVFTLAIQSDEFSEFIELLETQGDVQVLSSPRVSTLNNQKAVIKVGSDEFFVTDVSTTTVTSTTTTTNPDVTLTPFFSGIALDVTPQIDEDGYITLHVHPSISEVQDQTKTIAIGDDTLELPLAFSTIRETDSVVRARSGQIVVIGGLMQDTLADRRASIPWVAKIPILGSLFEQNFEEALKKELVILMRPIAVTRDTWREVLKESADRLDAMKARQVLGGTP
ncbi:MAG: pilus (MSHA type) biogenesis protein MshL [Myxococcota bacterium]